MRIRSIGSRSERVELQMTPMIDIVFQMLVFFIMTFKIVLPEGDFNIKMPRAAPREGLPDEMRLPPIQVRLTASQDGKLAGLQMNDQPLTSFQALRQRIIDLVGDDRGPGSLHDPTTKGGRAAVMFFVPQRNGLDKVQAHGPARCPTVYPIQWQSIFLQDMDKAFGRSEYELFPVVPVHVEEPYGGLHGGTRMHGNTGFLAHIFLFSQGYGLCNPLIAVEFISNALGNTIGHAVGHIFAAKGDHIGHDTPDRIVYPFIGSRRQCIGLQALVFLYDGGDGILR